MHPDRSRLLARAACRRRWRRRSDSGSITARSAIRGTDWEVRTTASTGDVLAGIAAAQRQLWATLFALALLFCGLGAWAMQRLLRPLQTLQRDDARRAACARSERRRRGRHRRRSRRRARRAGARIRGAARRTAGAPQRARRAPRGLAARAAAPGRDLALDHRGDPGDRRRRRCRGPLPLRQQRLRALVRHAARTHHRLHPAAGARPARVREDARMERPRAGRRDRPFRAPLPARRRHPEPRDQLHPAASRQRPGRRLRRRLAGHHAPSAGTGATAPARAARRPDRPR